MRRSAIATLVLGFWVAGCSGSGNAEGEIPATVRADSPNAALAAAFGSPIPLAQERTPTVFQGDFDGDGHTDMIALARADSLPRAIPPDVRVLQPWTTPGAPPPVDLSRGADVVLAVVHGDEGGTGAGFLLHDPDTISILDAGVAREAFVVDRSSAAALSPEVGGRARGDVLVIPTEAGIDTYLYWDGSTYRAYQPVEYP